MKFDLKRVENSQSITKNPYFLRDLNKLNTKLHRYLVNVKTKISFYNLLKVHPHNKEGEYLMNNFHFYDFFFSSATPEIQTQIGVARIFNEKKDKGKLFIFRAKASDFLQIGLTTICFSEEISLPNFKSNILPTGVWKILYLGEMDGFSQFEFIYDMEWKKNKDDIIIEHNNIKKKQKKNEKQIQNLYREQLTQYK